MLKEECAFLCYTKAQGWLSPGTEPMPSELRCFCTSSVSWGLHPQSFPPHTGRSSKQLQIHQAYLLMGSQRKLSNSFNQNRYNGVPKALIALCWVPSLSDTKPVPQWAWLGISPIWSVRNEEERGFHMETGMLLWEPEWMIDYRVNTEILYILQRHWDLDLKHAKHRPRVKVYETPPHKRNCTPLSNEVQN